MSDRFRMLITCISVIFLDLVCKASTRWLKGWKSYYFVLPQHLVNSTVIHFHRFEKLWRTLWWTLNWYLSYCDGQFFERWLAHIRLVNKFHVFVYSCCPVTACLDHKYWLRNRCCTDCPSQTLFSQVLSITFYITEPEGDFTCYNSSWLTQGTLHGYN